MPCSLCKNVNHTLKECTDISIQTKINEISSICVRMVSLPEDTGTFQLQLDTDNLLNQLTTYVNSLSHSMLKSILYTKRAFRYIPTEQYSYDRNGDYSRGYDHPDVSGNKKTLVGKIILLFLTNTRREYPIEFLKKDYFVRKLWFEKQMYCDALSSNLSDIAARDYQLRYPRLVDKCYIAWISALTRDSEELIKKSLDNFRLNAVSRSEYDLCISRNRENELNFHQVHNQHCFQALYSIKYNQLEGLYIKKKIMEHLISQYNGSIHYAYGARHTIVLDVNNIPERMPRHQLSLSIPTEYRRRPQLMPQPVLLPMPQISGDPDAQRLYIEEMLHVPNRPPCAPANLRKLNIGIVLDKEFATCNTFDCPICMDTKTDKDGIMRLNCSHEFCACCTTHFLNDYRSKTSKPACPLCRGVIHQITLKNSDILEDKEIIKNLHNICVL